MLFSQQYIVCVRCPLLGSDMVRAGLSCPEVHTAVLLSLLLWEAKACAIQSNPASGAGFQPAWCDSQLKRCSIVGHLPSSRCLRFVFPHFRQSCSMLSSFSEKHCCLFPLSQNVWLFVCWGTSQHAWRLLLSILKHSDFAAPEDISSNYLSMTSEIYLLYLNL